MYWQWSFDKYIFMYFRVPTAAAWGGGATILGLFLTDWKVITGYIPYIKDKYDHVPPK